jgi:CHAT domain-containing protein/tetratricopeptide (TPR) repeat protein
LPDNSESFAGFEERCAEVMRQALSDLPAAMLAGRQLVDSAGQDPARSILARVAYSHAQCYAGDLSGGLETLRGAEAMTDDAGPALRARLLKAMVQPLMRLGRLDEANAAAHASLDAARSGGVNTEIAKSLVCLGASERSLGRTDEAERALREAIPLAGADRWVAAAAASNLAECLLDHDRFDEALSTFALAAGEFEAIGQQHAAAIASGNIADLLGRLGRLDPAMDAFERARRSFESSGARLDAARLLCEEAGMLAAAGSLRAARDRCVAALPDLEFANAGADLARARLTLGLVLLELGDPTSARNLLEQAHRGVASDSVLATDASLGVARCDLADGLPLEGLKRVEVLAARLRDRPARLLRTLLLKADLLLALSRVDESIDALASADRLARATGLTGLIPLVSLGRARCALAAGQTDLAIGLLDAAADEAASTIRSTSTQAARAGLARQFAVIFTLRTTCLLDRSEDRGIDAAVRAAFYAEPEDSRASDPAAHDDLGTADIRARLDRVAQDIMRLQVSAGIFPDARSAAEIEAMNARAEVLRERLGRASTLAPSPPSLDEVRSQLSEGEALACWFRDREGLSAFVLRRDRAEVVRGSAEMNEILSKCRRAAFLAERAASSEERDPDAAWRSVIGSLRDALLRPLSERRLLPAGPGSRLIVCGAEAIRGIPWLALFPDQGDPGMPDEVVVASGLRDALRGTEPRQESLSRVLLIAAEDPSLPYAPREVEDAAACWPAAQVIVGGRADGILDRIPDADAIHLATHGVFVPDRPRRSRFWIGDRWVTADELASRIKPGAFVVLSACHAGRSGGLAEDRAGIPGVLRASGAGVVVAPIWPLADRSAAAVARSIHQGLARLQRPPHGVARAVQEAIRESMHRGDASSEVWGLVVYGGKIP